MWIIKGEAAVNYYRSIAFFRTDVIWGGSQLACGHPARQVLEYIGHNLLTYCLVAIHVEGRHQKPPEPRTKTGCPSSKPPLTRRPHLACDFYGG